MDDDLLKQPEQVDTAVSFWSQHRLFLLIIVTVFLAVVLTSVSVAIYNYSGAAQLDLSRPGYQSVADQVDENIGIDGYSAFGPVDEKVIVDFIELYDEQSKKATAVDAFNGDPLNPELLQFAPVSQ